MNNPLDPSLRLLNDCGCSAGTGSQTPAVTDNRPGLPAIRFRAGVHSQFKGTLLGALSSQAHPALRALRARESDDFTIALLDAFAGMADVLTFYSERIANEAYLRTATERRSVLELARAIGYELAPGVAAQVMLAFSIEGGRGAPGMAIIPRGTKVQSIPGPGEKPQTFETSLEFTGRAAWNDLRPRLRSVPLPASKLLTAKELFLAGVSTNLRRGDVLVLSDGATARARRIAELNVDRERDHTQVRFEVPETKAVDTSVETLSARNTVIVPPDKELTAKAVDELFVKGSVSATEMFAIGRLKQWDMTAVQDYLNHLSKVVLSTPKVGVFALRTRVGLFGHNAPKWTSLPHTKLVSTTTTTRIVKTESGEKTTESEVKKEEHQNEAYPISWDTDQRTIWEDSQGADLVARTGFDVLLERTVSEVVKDGWVVLETAKLGQELLPLRIGRAAELSRADYGMSAKCTGLKLENVAGTDISVTDKSSAFANRTTTAYIQSESLTVIGAPIEMKLQPGDKRLPLDRVDKDLKAGQAFALKGENADLPGTMQREILVIADTEHGDVTTLILREGLKHRYVRSTVTLNANVVPATHGETTREVLGSGDALHPFQQFTLKQKPLTYAFAPGAGRPESTLEVWVNDVKWREVDTFYDRGPKERVYVVRRADDGTTTVQFGDSRRGARLPTGRENVRAVYRKGIGLEGLVQEEQLSLLLTQPLGVKGVSNVLAPEGAEDPQSLEDSRVNAPRTVITLDRVVSLQDYEDFARDFPGVEKAHAVWCWSGEAKGVVLTLLGPNGRTIHDSDKDPPAAPLRKGLVQQGIPRVPIRMVTRPPSLFSVSGIVRVDTDRVVSAVRSEIGAALRDAFSFSAREFGRGVHLSEVIAVIQNVSGVAFIDVAGFQKTSLLAGKTDITAAVQGYLNAFAPTNGVDMLLAEPAELLILDESSLPLLKVESL